MTKRVMTITVAVLTVLLLALAVPGGAATWPVKPIEVIIPYAPGGGSDVTARIFASTWRSPWGSLWS